MANAYRNNVPSTYLRSWLSHQGQNIMDPWAGEINCLEPDGTQLGNADYLDACVEGSVDRWGH